MEVRPSKASDLTLKGAQDAHMCSQEERLVNLKTSLELASDHDQRMAVMKDIYLICLQEGDYESVVQWTGAIIDLTAEPGQDLLLHRWAALTKLGHTVPAAATLRKLKSMPLDEGIQDEMDVLEKTFSAESERDEAISKCEQLRKEGNEMMKMQKKEDAIIYYTAALKAYPCDVKASNNRAQANLDLKRFEEAERDASVALRYEPENSKARYRRARARFQRQQPNIHGACADLVTVVKKDPTQKEAIQLLFDLVEKYAGGSTVGNDKSTGAAVHGHVSFPDGTEPGDHILADEEKIAHDKEVEAMHPHSAKTHWPTGKRRAGLVILEEDDGDGNECSWCPVVESNEQGLEQVSHAYGLRGEKFHDGKEAKEALAAFARGAVTYPMNSFCWMGLAKVHRVLQNYTESKEAAYRAIKVDAGPFPALSLALSSFHADADTLSRDERLANLRHATQRVENSRNITPLEQGQESILNEAIAVLHGHD